MGFIYPIARLYIHNYCIFWHVCNFRTNLTGVVGDEVLRHLSDYLANDITHEWSGYIIVNNHRADTKIPGNVGLHIDGFVTLSMLHFGPYEQAYNSIKNLYEFRPDLTEGTRQIMNYTTFLEYEKTVTDAINFRQYIGRYGYFQFA